jgi:hypothetical protein
MGDLWLPTPPKKETNMGDCRYCAQSAPDALTALGIIKAFGATDAFSMSIEDVTAALQAEDEQ